MNENRRNDALMVLSRLKADRPALFERAEVVGAWVWIAFDSKPDFETREYLKLQGFTWNHKRACWQHCGGVFRPSSPGNPRWKYGSIPAAEIELRGAA
jgi:hypothetical protein